MPAIQLRESPNYDLIGSTAIGVNLDATEWQEYENMMSNINGNGYLAFSAQGRRVNGEVYPIIGAPRQIQGQSPVSMSFSSTIAPGVNRFMGYISFQYHVNIYIAAYLTMAGSDVKIFEMSKEIDNNYSGTVVTAGLIGSVGTVGISGLIPESFRAFGQSKDIYLKLQVDFTDRGEYDQGENLTTGASWPSFAAASHGITQASIWFYKECNEC